MNEHYVVISHSFSIFFGKVSAIIALPRTFLLFFYLCPETASLVIEIFLLILERNSAKAIEKVSDIFSIFIRQNYLDAIH